MPRSLRHSAGNDAGRCGAQMESGRGQYVYDDAGAKYLDCVNSAAQVGHCASSVVSATGDAFCRLSDDWGSASEGPAELERLLSQTLPPTLDCFLFCDSGSEAVDLAVRLARLWHCSSSRLPATAIKHDTDSKYRKHGSKNKQKSTKSLDSTKCQSGSLLTPDSSGYRPPYRTTDREINPGGPGPSTTSLKYSGERLDPRTGSYYNEPYCKSGENDHLALPGSSKLRTNRDVFDDPTFSTGIFEVDDCNPQRDRGSRVHSAYTSCDSDFSSVSSGFTNDSGFYSSEISGGTSSAEDFSNGLCVKGDIAVVNGSFHGCTESLFNLSSRMNSLSNDDMSQRVVVIPAPDLARAPGLSSVTTDTDPQLLEKAVTYYLDATEKVLQDAIMDGTKIAGFLCEPLLTIQGVQQPPNSWLQGVYRLMREQCGALCISDEVQCGLGRLGDDMWGFQALGVEPDIVVAGKGLGNGFPMAVTITSQEIASKLGHMKESYRCSGVQSAVGSAVMDSLQREQLLQATSDTGRHLTRLLNKLKKKHTCVGDVRGRGLMHAVELVWSTREGAPSPEIAEFLVVKLRRVGVVIAREGIHRNVLLIMPPLTFDELDSATLIGKLDEALALVPHNFSEEETKESKARRRCPPDLGLNDDYSTPGPSGTAEDRSSRRDDDDVIPVTDSYQASTSSGYSPSRHYRSRSTHSNYPMPAEPIYPSMHSEKRDTTTQKFPYGCSTSGPHFSGQFDQDSTTKHDPFRHSDSASNRYPYPGGYQQKPHPSNYDVNSSSYDSFDEASCRQSFSNSGSKAHRNDMASFGSSVAGNSGTYNSLASPERNSGFGNGTKSKLSKQSPPNKKGKSDIFSNIDFKVRESVPPVADVLSGVPGIMNSGSTFVNPPAGGRGSRSLSSRSGSSSRAAPNHDIRSPSSSRTRPSTDNGASPLKTGNLHPDENPRSCSVTHVGLGMVAPLAAKTSPLHSPRHTDYEDFDD